MQEDTLQAVFIKREHRQQETQQNADGFCVCFLMGLPEAVDSANLITNNSCDLRKKKFSELVAEIVVQTGRMKKRFL